MNSDLRDWWKQPHQEWLKRTHADLSTWRHPTSPYDWTEFLHAQCHHRIAEGVHDRYLECAIMH